MSTTPEARGVFQPEAIVAGGGLIGLACTTAIARMGLRVLVVSSSEQGAASPAAAGILAPSVGNSPTPVRRLGEAARDMYPDYVEAIALRTGKQVPLDRSGLLEIAFTEGEATTLRESIRKGSEWIDAPELRDLEPLLAPAEGAAYHRDDGAVDVPALLDALRTEAERDPHISLIEGRVTRIGAEQQPVVVELDGHRRLEAENVVVAPGAWVGAINGLPRPLPVAPVRGQVLAFESSGIRHVIMGPSGYLLQRGNRTLVGSTMEHVGFDAQPTAEGAIRLMDVARELSPAVAGGPLVAQWAGLRPVTPDFLPIVGSDPDREHLFYACGHSKNGVLLAPLTGRVIADLIAHGSSPIDVTPYAPDRFARMGR